MNTFKSSKGTLCAVSSDVVMEVLRGWESWSGKTSDYWREIGLSRMQMVTMIQKAKKLVKSGAVTESEFKEIAMPAAGLLPRGSSGAGIEVQVDAARLVRFFQVDQVLEFLKKPSDRL